MSSPRTQQALERLADLTPRQIVEELDRYIVGQADAKKAVAIASAAASEVSEKCEPRENSSLLSWPKKNAMPAEKSNGHS